MLPFARRPFNCEGNVSARWPINFEASNFVITQLLQIRRNEG